MSPTGCCTVPPAGSLTGGAQRLLGGHAVTAQKLLRLAGSDVETFLEGVWHRSHGREEAESREQTLMELTLQGHSLAQASEAPVHACKHWDAPCFIPLLLDLLFSEHFRFTTKLTAHFFSVLNNIPLSGCATVCLTIYLLKK